MLVALMGASLLMSTGITGAFGDRAWRFVTGYLVIQLGRTLFLIVALRGHRLREHFVNALPWEIAAGALWIAGALTGGDTRLYLFAAAVAVTYLGVATVYVVPFRSHRFDLSHTEIPGEHLFERFRLFFILALGETVLVISTVFTEQPATATRLLALGVAFAGAVALWWCYFQRLEGLGTRAAETADDPGAIGFVTTFVLTIMLLALIAVAVGSELTVAHPDDSPYPAFSVLVFGGRLSSCSPSSGGSGR
jgi:low temperature requirement protein LtrA